MWGQAQASLRLCVSARYIVWLGSRLRGNDEVRAHKPTPIVDPPSTIIACPVMKVDAGEAR